MNGNDSLDVILKDIISIINPTEEDWSIRFRILNELKDVIESMESIRGATVEPFGSFVSNLFTRWGDLDISVELSTNSHISSAGRKYKQNLLGEILKALVQKGGFRISKFIANAKVPILKIISRSNNISCDISINNLSGNMKSKILFWMNEIDGRFRDLVLMVKEWARAHNINDPKAGSFNSYSLSLLVIFHFQTCVPAILPPIREIYPGNMVDALRGVRADVEEHIKQTCEVQIHKFRTNRSRKINRSSLSQLFISFLAKFSDISLRAPSHGISIYNSQWEEIENNMSWLPKTYALFIEDPFEQPTNTARTVSNKQLKRISEAFQRSYQLLASGSWNRFSVIYTLAPPQTLKYLARTPAGSQYFNGSNGFGTGPQGPQVMHLPKQHQAKEKGPVMHQSRFVQSINGTNGGTSGRFMQSFNGRSDGTSSGFVQSYNGGRALQPPHQQKSQKIRIAEPQAGPFNRPVPQSSNGRFNGTSSGFVQSYNGGRALQPLHQQKSQKIRIAEPQAGPSYKHNPQSSNGRSNGTSSGFVQSYNGGRALQPPHQQKSQQIRIADPKAGPSNTPVPQISNGQKAKTWKPKTETVSLDAKREEKEIT